MSYPFLIWTVQRTGGTSLTELLMKMSEHKSADHEPFNWRRHTPRQFGPIAQQWAETKNHAALERALGEIFSEGYLIKHCYELHGTPFGTRMLRAAAKTNYRHILLLRRDELTRLVSKYIAEANGTWFKDHAAKVYAGIASQRNVLQPLPVEQMVRHYENCARMTEQLRGSLEQFNVHAREIWYEDIYTGDRETRMGHLNRLFEFLGFTPETVEAHQADIEEKIFDSSQRTRDILQFVPNLAEVRDALAAAGLQSAGDIPGYNPETATATDDIKAAPAKPPRPAPEGAARPNKPGMQVNSAAEGIHKRGYRNFVGGANMWEPIGDLQFKFLLQRGLKPEDSLVDVGCGALRGGVRFIKYLDDGNYYGIDKHIELIIYGVANELSASVFRQKMPHFVISNSFEFQKLRRAFNYGIAQSLFNVLSADDIRLCLSRLHEVAADGCKFYATFFETDMPDADPDKSQSAKGSRFTRQQMEAFGTDTGWQSNYIGNWSHPRGQKIIEYVRPPRST